MLVVDESLRPDFLQLRPPLPFSDDEVLPPLPCESESEQALSLKVKCGMQYVRVSQQSVDEAPCMISLKAKEQSTEVRAYGMDLMCVIDKSNSMKGRPIELVQRSLMGLFTRLCERDRVSIVVFNDKAERKCPLILCTEEGKARLQNIIQAITCEGNTSIARGFIMGLEVLKRRQSPNQSVSVWLFSDGKNNRDGDPTVSCMSALQECNFTKFSVFTFGYRKSLDAKLLEALAERGNGQFHYITEEVQIGQVFAYTMGSVTSVVARDVRVTISIVSGCKVLCDILKVYSKDCSNMYVLPDIHANEQKELIFLLKPHYLQLLKNLDTPAVQVILTYTDNEGTEATSSANMNVKFFTMEAHPVGTQDAVVFRHWFRVRGADYLREARDLATRSRFEEANQLLANGIEALRASGYVEVPLVQSVLKDMIQAKELVKSNVTWEHGGEAHFASISYSHFSQSATALTAQYASVQQTAQLSVIPELPDTHRS
jgi:Ca-activated chloride channel family protein